MKQTFLALSVCLLGLVSARAQTLTSLLEVYQIFQNKCIACHDHQSPEAGLDLEGVGASTFVKALNVASKLNAINPSNPYATAQGLKRVYPGRPDKSFLFRKINNGLDSSLPALHADEGGNMPQYPGEQLTNAEKEIIRQWILYGAKTSGTQFDADVVRSFYDAGGDKSFPDGPPPAPDPQDGFQIKMGPFFLAPDGEVEYYQKYELNLPANVEVDRLEILISGYSHHFIVYHFDSPSAANNIPHGLRLNANHFDIGLTAAVQEQTDLRLPEGTAFRWDKNKVLDLNSHYINYSLSKPYQCEAYVNVYTKPVGTAAQEMFATLLVNPNIPIPNNGNTITHTAAEFQFGADSLYIWGLMGHTHKYGTGYRVWERLPNGQKGTLIYDASCSGGIPGCPAPYFDYQHIPLRYWEPQLLPIKWSNGIIHEAKWVNDGPNSLNFGPTSDDEMMVLIAFYTLNQITVGTEEPGQLPHGNLRIYPNPCTGPLWVDPADNMDTHRIAVFDLTGRIVYQQVVTNQNTIQLELDKLLPGMYFLEVNGRTTRFVKD